MKKPSPLIVKFRDQSGVSAVLFAVLIVPLICFIALAVDYGYYYVTCNELQNIADGAALAATRQLGVTYQTLSGDEQTNYVCDPLPIIAKAKAIAARNWAGRKTDITINDADVIIGEWDGTSLNPTLNQPDAVSVTARRDSNANDPISTFFARIRGINTFDVRRDATAALTGQGTSDPGELEIPMGISRYFFDEGYCNGWIKFSPTNDPDSCAGWTSFSEAPPNDPVIRRILEGLITSPATTADETEFSFIGGELSVPTFDALLTLFEYKGYDVLADGETPAQVDANGNPVPGPLPDGSPGTEPLFDADGNRLLYPDGIPRNRHLWETAVVVYDWGDCSNPNTAIYIVGYSTIIMTDVLGPPDKLVLGKVLCDRFSNFDTRGGGGQFGTKGTIPGLVK